MPLQLLPADKTDIPRAIEIEHAAYGPSPFTPVLFPGPFPTDSKHDRTSDLIRESEEDPSTRWLKVVDTDSGESIAFAKWHVYDPRPLPKKPREFGEGCNVEACELLFGSLAQLRERNMQNKPYIYLHMLQTDPKHQRRGAGGMLIQWGIDEGDRRNLPCYLESSVAGRPLYHKYGFRDIEEQKLDFSKWGIEEPHRSWAMIREASN